MKRRLKVQQLEQVEKDASKLDAERAKVRVAVEKIIKEQEAIIEATSKGIKSLNTDLKALHLRLKVYVSRKPKELNDTYYDLRDRYTNKLAERAALERARVLSAESIAAARLHIIPGE
jgi:hypothetical protein